MLENRLKLVRRAREEGRDNRPLKDDRDLDDTQSQILEEIRAGANLLKQFLSNQLSDAEKNIRSRMPRKVEVALALADARAAAAEAKLKHQATLISMRLTERRSMRNENLFRANNQLARDAAYSDDWWMPGALIFAIFVGESIANAFIFREAVDLGLAGGFLLAALVGFVNVLLGFIAGFVGLRLVNHVNWFAKIFGFLITIGLFAAGFFWNLLVAHFRDFLETSGGTLTTTVFFDMHLLLSPSQWFTLSKVEAWALFFIGLGVFLIAALKGRGGRGSFVDPYWGYRAVDLTHREREEEYREGQDEYKSAVIRAYEDARASVRAAHASDAEATAQIREIADQAQGRAQEVRDSIGEWIEMGVGLLRKYRDENRKIRTAPPPAYFDEYPTFPDLYAELGDASGLRSLSERALDVHEANIIALAELEETLAGAKEQETKLFLREIDEIEARAQSELEKNWPAPGMEQKPKLRVAG